MTHYITRAELKKYLSITSTDDDPILDFCIETAEKQVENHTGRKFWLDTTASTRLFKPQHDYRVLYVDDIGSTSGLTIKTDDRFDGSFSTIWDSSEYQLEPFQSATPVEPQYVIRAVGTRTFPCNPYGKFTISVTAKWGFPTVPSAVIQATYLLASRLYKRKNSPEGLLTYPDFGVVRIGRVDPDVAALLSSYQLHGVRYF